MTSDLPAGLLPGLRKALQLVNAKRDSMIARGFDGTETIQFAGHFAIEISAEIYVLERGIAQEREARRKDAQAVYDSLPPDSSLRKSIDANLAQSAAPAAPSVREGWDEDTDPFCFGPAPSVREYGPRVHDTHTIVGADPNVAETPIITYATPPASPAAPAPSGVEREEWISERIYLTTAAENLERERDEARAECARLRDAVASALDVLNDPHPTKEWPAEFIPATDSIRFKLRAALTLTAAPANEVKT